MRKNERLYDVFKRRGYDMVVLSQPENVLHATGMVTLPNIYAVGFFNWSLPLATFIADLRNDKELLIIADSVAGDVKKYAFTKEVRTFHPYDLSVEMHPANEYEKAVREAVYELGGGARIAVEPSLTMAAQRAIKAVLLEAELIDASEAIFESKAIKAPWEIERMKKAAAYLVGEHDFTSFCTKKEEVTNCVRTIYSLDVEKNGDMITIRIRGNGFLYNMVRIITGTLLRVGGGLIEPERIPEILAAKDRSAAAETAPAHGLKLVKIEYPDFECLR